MPGFFQSAQASRDVRQPRQNVGKGRTIGQSFEGLSSLFEWVPGFVESSLVDQEPADVGCGVCNVATVSRSRVDTEAGAIGGVGGLEEARLPIGAAETIEGCRFLRPIASSSEQLESPFEVLDAVSITIEMVYPSEGDPSHPSGDQIFTLLANLHSLIERVQGFRETT